MNEEYLYKHIEDNNICYARVISGDKVRYKVTEANNSKKIVNGLKTFFSRYPGQYTVFLKKTPTTADRSGEHIDIYINSDHYENTPAPAPAINVDQLRAQITKEIKEDIKRREQEREKEEEIKELKEEIKRLKDPINKLGEAAITILQGIPQTKQLFSMVPLQGTYKTNVSEEEEGEELSKEENAAIDEAVEIFLHYVEPVDLLKLANKVKANPKIIDSLKMLGYL
jgi:vacuolar-type H+-ATPase subunit I/STV1